MSLEQDLLDAADQLEKTAAEIETNEKKETEAEEKKETPAEEKKEEKKEEEEKEEPKKETPKKEEVSAKDSKETEDLKEELGISEELAEKVASVDPSVLEYIKNLSQVPVESMGDDDTRDKTASVEDEDPFDDFLRSPL